MSEKVTKESAKEEDAKQIIASLEQLKNRMNEILSEYSAESEINEVKRIQVTADYETNDTANVEIQITARNFKNKNETNEKKSLLNIFKMDECDYVAAPTLEEAKSFWEKQTGLSREEIDESFETDGMEMSHDQLVFIPIEALPDQTSLSEIKDVLVYENNTVGIKSTFSWFLERENITETQLIASIDF